ncbi:M56 family metallopeptidase [Massilia forsythiae]|uniref:M56 family metallopeptidase n=1 Tax=Massilia forsythiae TaxID=2728020 RepID=A0A7Z2ZTM9_9BURK|nr:M56 family metallopeptidase [Massilia forsythiae]QJE01693.1 M56 family metallopeptidase [Massilia forsythiae]
MSAPALVAAIGWALLDFVWQGALIGCATAVALTLLRNARPETRYAAACAGLLLCLAWPAAQLILALQAGPDTAVAGSALRGAAADVRAGAGGGLPAWLGSHLTLLVGAWAACSGALALRMGLGLLWIGRAARGRHSDPAWQARLSGLAARCGVGRAVRLCIVDNLSSPVTAGWWRPVVLVPAALVSGMPPQLLEALLAHELGHVRRHDYLVNLLQNVIETLLFYHPAVWWISRRIRSERELIADDIAARTLGEPRRLALALSELERLQFSTHHLAQAANGGDLMTRIKRLLRPDTQALNWKAAIPVLGLAAICGACAQAPSAPPADRAPAMANADAPAPTTRAVIDFNSCAKPVYPQTELAANHQGTVTMSFRTEADGSISASRVDKSSGFPSLDDAALTALAKCRFKPAVPDGQLVSSWVPVKYVWTTQ